MNMRSVFLLNYLMFFSLISHAGNVQVSQWIPWNFISQELKNLPLEINLSKPSLDLSIGDLKPQIQGLEFSLTGRLTKLTLSPDIVQTSFQNMNAKIKIGKLSIDQVITRDIGGNLIRIRIQAICQPFEIQIPRLSAIMNSQLRATENYWSPTITELFLSITNKSWHLSPIECVGPQGIDAQISSQITNALSRPEDFQELIKSWMAPQLDASWKEHWNKLLSSSADQFKILAMGEPQENGFHLLGEISIEKNIQILLPEKTESNLSISSPQFIISKEGFSVLVEENLKKQLPQAYNLQQVDGFKKLMKSRFMQFFVWSDLLHFGRSTPFLLSTNEEFKKFNMTASGAGKWNLQLQSTGVIEVNRKGNPYTYLNWGLGLSSNLITELKEGHMNFKIVNSKVNINTAFGTDYVKTFRPSQRISSSVMKKVGESLFENKQIGIDLPNMTWKNKTWKLQNWQESKNLILMDWK